MFSCELRGEKGRLGIDAGKIMGKGYGASVNHHSGVVSGVRFTLCAAAEPAHATRGQKKSILTAYLPSGASSPSPREGGLGLGFAIRVAQEGWQQR